MAIKPELNIGLTGHVDHGKTTLVQALSGTWTDRYSEELERGITIKLGYADAVLRKCENCEEYTVNEKCPECEGSTEILRKVSFVDAPGHEALMTTTISGAAIMDGAVIVIAANEDCPRPQTREHLTALEITGVENIVIAQNKIDMVDKEQAKKNYNQIKEFVKGTVAEDAPIVPISAEHNVNIGKLIESVQNEIPTPERDPDANPRLNVARSFDVNKPGTSPEDLLGGVIGGSLIKGKLNEGDEIELRPGRLYEQHETYKNEPIITEVTDLRSGKDPIDEATPGGLLGIGTKLDPNLTQDDYLSGNVLGKPGDLPPVWENSISIEVHLLDTIVGMEEEKEVEPLRSGEQVLLNVGTARTVGLISDLGGGEAEISIEVPISADVGDHLALSRRIGTRWRLIGHGIITE